MTTRLCLPPTLLLLSLPGASAKPPWSTGGRGGNGWARHGHPGTEGPFRNLSRPHESPFSHESPFPLPGSPCSENCSAIAECSENCSEAFHACVRYYELEASAARSRVHFPTTFCTSSLNRHLFGNWGDDIWGGQMMQAGCVPGCLPSMASTPLVPPQPPPLPPPPLLPQPPPLPPHAPQRLPPPPATPWAPTENSSLRQDVPAVNRLPKRPPRLPAAPPPLVPDNASELLATSAPEASYGEGARTVVGVACAAVASAVLVGLCLCRRRAAERGSTAEYSLGMATLVGKGSVHFSEASVSLVASSRGSTLASMGRLLPSAPAAATAGLDCRSSTSASPSAPEIPAGDVKLLRKVGRGGQGIVFAGEWLGTAVAVKVVQQGRRAAAHVRTEAEMLAKLRHPCVCSFFGVCDVAEDWKGVEAGGVAMVMELLHISAYDFLHRRPPDADEVDARLCLRIAHETAMGIAYLHRNHCMHRDIKPGNVMLDQMQHARVCDFGLAALARDTRLDGDGAVDGPLDSSRNSSSDGGVRHTAGLGTPRYMAPEMLAGTMDPGGASHAGPQPRLQYDERCDVYSFGMLLWEVMHRQVPFAEYTGMQVALTLAPSRERPPLDLPTGLKELEGLISSCWHHDATQRPPMSTCVEVLAASTSSFASMCSHRPQAEDGGSSSCTPSVTASNYTPSEQHTAKLASGAAFYEAPAADR